MNLLEFLNRKGPISHGLFGLTSIALYNSH